MHSRVSVEYDGLMQPGVFQHLLFNRGVEPRKAVITLINLHVILALIWRDWMGRAEDTAIGAGGRRAFEAGCDVSVLVNHY
ncbi:hypothetical protein BOTBODRAFT_67373 [Botryobasidium botryosum FD-172 SS1]|uniref:Uncharacterized protein n=1 Tax=Botryobasidium botryosum (strain FD-172 SS1) TaxID=930990 RepID=A0A067MKQ0_BOTB1|nr:hypothetical protein BOTBODRAFT_67373 [Botryobasidium botryosum FD-172 SS1]